MDVAQRAKDVESDHTTPGLEKERMNFGEYLEYLSKVLLKFVQHDAFVVNNTTYFRECWGMQLSYICAYPPSA